MIRELADAGLLQDAIAAEVGCSQQTVSRTLLGKGKKY
jgi:DNA-binding XRE family transcriptional regulator